MSNTNHKKADPKQVESLIKQAVKKINAGKENDICRYIPFEPEGYIHHFTMKKMKSEDPTRLVALITKYIITPDNPHKVKPKKRAARGSRKQRDQMLFSKNDIERILSMARLSNDHEIIRKLAPTKDFRALKKELISSIRRGEVEQELWNTYSEMAQVLVGSH